MLREWKPKQNVNKILYTKIKGYWNIFINIYICIHIYEVHELEEIQTSHLWKQETAWQGPYLFKNDLQIYIEV